MVTSLPDTARTVPFNSAAPARAGAAPPAARQPARFASLLHSRARRGPRFVRAQHVTQERHQVRRDLAYLGELAFAPDAQEDVARSRQGHDGAARIPQAGRVAAGGIETVRAAARSLVANEVQLQRGRGLRSRLVATPSTRDRSPLHASSHFHSSSLDVHWGPVVEHRALSHVAHADGHSRRERRSGRRLLRFDPIHRRADPRTAAG